VASVTRRNEEEPTRQGQDVPRLEWRIVARRPLSQRRPHRSAGIAEKTNQSEEETKATQEKEHVEETSPSQTEDQPEQETNHAKTKGQTEEVTPTVQSRSQYDWRPDYSVPPPMPARRRSSQAISRIAHDWRPNISGPQSTAEAYAQKFGIPVPYWAKQGIHWKQAIPMGLSGLGQSTQQISAIAATGASTTVGILVALGTIAGPIGAVAAGLIAVGQVLVGVFKGCGQTCIDASNIANQVAQALEQNLSEYMSAPVHTESMQAAALNNFQTAWNALTQACGNPALLSAGKNCISDRQQGSCAYKTSPGGWQQTNGTWKYVSPGPNNSGSACWNWWIGYHDPIANDPTVVPDAVVTTASPTPGGTATNITTPVTGPSELGPIVLIGGAVLLLLLLL
jgi:hypothetical protein